MLGKILPIAGSTLRLLEETDPPAATFSLSTLLADSGDILTAMLGWVSDVFEVIVDNPILLLAIIGSMALISIGIVRRLLRL